MRERAATYLPIAGLLGAFGVCCGLPLLLSLGLLGGIAGVSLQSWPLVGVGVMVAGVGLLRLVRRRVRRVTDSLALPAHEAVDLQTNNDHIRNGDGQ
ncbi:MAG: hypothetical protein LH603_12870 [Pseudonocardia sp.]|nr:hypothetical protein [Pseudonocardia sp.]